MASPAAFAQQGAFAATGASRGSVPSRRCAAGASSSAQAPASCSSLSFRAAVPAQKLACRGAARGRGAARAQPCVVVVSQATANMPANLKKIVVAFQAVPDPMARYKQLLFYASKLKPLAAELHTNENKVQGCVSQVWVVPEIREGKVYFAADSDSQLTKGLAALLVEGLSGAEPKEILGLTPDFIEMLGLKQSLTPSRNNGFLNMLKLMQKKTLQLVAACGSGEEEATPAAASPAPAAAPAAAAAAGDGSVHATMEAKLKEALAPQALQIVDDSSKHAGHNAMNGLRSGETHFTVQVVSAKFEGMPLVQRHRLIYQLLDAEIKAGVHALSIVAKTPAEEGR